MKRYMLRRLAVTIAVLLGAATASFFMLRLVPGDPAEAMAGQDARPEDIRLIRKQLGLDRPLHEQYVRYMLQLSRGELGESIRSRRPVMQELAEHVPKTLSLAASSMGVALLLGIPVGVIAAARRGSWIDLVTISISLVGISMPSFWLGLLLIMLFSVQLKLLPFFGIAGPASYILPSLTLGLAVAGNIARLTRASMLEVLGQDYIRTARAKGLAERVVIFKHGLRAAAIPIVTVMGLQLGTLLGGAVVTESLFAWPGLGRLIVGAISTRDFPVVQGGILLFAMTFVILNFVADLTYHVLDPRVRL